MWAKMHSHINTITPCTKLRFFQYRLLNRYLVTNVWLNRINPNVSDKCSFCALHKETVKHLIHDCDKVKKFWSALTRWSKHILELEIPGEYRAICLNKSAGPDKKIIDIIVLMAKQFIYAQRCLHKPLNFQAFIAKVVFYKNLEGVIAKRNNNMYQFNVKWYKFSNARM